MSLVRSLIEDNVTILKSVGGWNAENRKWIIHSLGGNTTKASTNSANSDYPLGYRVWEIQEGKCEVKVQIDQFDKLQ